MAELHVPTDQVRLAAAATGATGECHVFDQLARSSMRAAIRRNR